MLYHVLTEHGYNFMQKVVMVSRRPCIAIIIYA